VKVAILSRQYCQVAISVAEYFAGQALPVSLFVVETGRRTRFAQSERQFRKAHAEFAALRLRGSLAYYPFIIKNKLDEISLKLPTSFRSFFKPLVHLAYHRENVPPYAKRHAIAIEKVVRHSSQETCQVLKEHQIDYALLTTSAWLIKEPLLSLPGTKVINAHYAKLPEHRSLDAMQWSVFENDVTGLTTHFVDVGVDTGPILLFVEVPLQANDSLSVLRQRIEQKKPEAFYCTVRGLGDGTIKPMPQKPEEGIHHCPMTLEELQQTEAMLRRKTRTQV
jgi:folate-dependent phosphoribosylglycinamide formyltransferase PurN